ncbi:MAG: homoserine dehydrogenase [Actinobacteria bacterium]|nr:homoserine dehydrogenase [Actinomycetota bacterium]MCL5882542.1 homoserine dehydrogenase [Actinomycetota bacterium]
MGLLGYGTVGSNVYNLINNQAIEIAQATGTSVSVKKILVRDISVPREDAPRDLFTDNFEEILEDSEISLVVELIGGLEPAFDYITSVLERGKAVVTANKQLLSQKGFYLFRLARENNTQIGFEASVAGAIPVIKVLRESMVASDLTSVYGIVNGTTNFILSEMSRTGAKYGDALANAQEWGYAEADPTEDISGKDAAAKMAILASIAFHTAVDLEDVTCVGIEHINSLDISYARNLDLTIKLLGVAKLYGDRINVRVYPALLKKDHPLATVSGAYNAVFLKGNAIDEIMLSGPGAGGMETASAVVSDIASIIAREKPGEFENIASWREMEFYPDDEVISKFYLRLEVEDEPGVLAEIAQVFGDHEVSVESVIQQGRGAHAELVMVFHPVKEAGFREALEKIAGLPVVKSQPRPIRVEDNENEQ